MKDRKSNQKRSQTRYWCGVEKSKKEEPFKTLMKFSVKLFWLKRIHEILSNDQRIKYLMF